MSTRTVTRVAVLKDVEGREFRRDLFLGGMSGAVETATTETAQSPTGYVPVAPYVGPCHGVHLSEIAGVNALTKVLTRLERYRPIP